jgi:hypothetical protein
MSAVAPLSPESSIRQCPGFLQAEVDGEIVAMSAEKGTCYGLDAIGTRIWGLIGEFTPIAEICATLMREYRVTPDICEREVLALLEELRSEGMIEAR